MNKTIKKTCSIFVVILTLVFLVSPTNTQAKESEFEIVDGVLIKYHGESETVNIPDGVKKIGDRAFNNTIIESITIPESVKEIGDSVFYFCWGLKSITIPKNVIAIGNCFWQHKFLAFRNLIFRAPLSH